MAWLDDRAWCHPKLVNLSDRAFRVYVNSLSYSSGMGLGGVLTTQHQRLMGSTPALRRELIVAGAWDERGGDIYIHDWHVHNGKRDARKAADRERKKATRGWERPADSPADVPEDAPQYGSALKEVTVVKEVASATSTSGKRAPDELWEALIAELGDVKTKTERGERNAAHKELREAGATPEDVRARCRAYRRKWPEMALTASALKKHWSSLEGAKPRTERVEVPDRAEYSEEERLANLERVRGLTHSLGQEIA